MLTNEQLAEMKTKKAETEDMRIRQNEVVRDLLRYAVSTGKGREDSLIGNFLVQGPKALEGSTTDLYRIELGRVCQRISEQDDDQDLRYNLMVLAERYSNEILANRWTHNSTDAFSNAYREVQRLVAVEFIEFVYGVDQAVEALWEIDDEA
jgi:hypothetical protein